MVSYQKCYYIVLNLLYTVSKVGGSLEIKRDKAYPCLSWLTCTKGQLKSKFVVNFPCFLEVEMTLCQNLCYSIFSQMRGKSPATSSTGGNRGGPGFQHYGSSLSLSNGRADDIAATADLTTR